MKKKNVKTLFIINPISGVKKKKNISSLIEKHIDSESIDYDLAFTEYAGHGKEIALQAVKDQYNCVVAVGGDGTINEIAQALIDSSTKLGIIPMGSGNGLARHLQIPLNVTQAIELINLHHSVKIDTCYLNEHAFFCTAGIGFDADVAKRFSQAPKRGFSSYAQIVLKEFGKYRGRKVVIDAKEEVYFSLTFANASQYGNNVYISPNSNISDGVFEICKWDTFSKWKMLNYWIKLRSKKINSASSFSQKSTDTFQFSTPKTINAHIDGEPISVSGKMSVTINHQSLEVIVP